MLISVIEYYTQEKESKLFSKMSKTSVCVICNRCLYRRSVKRFDPDKYLFEFQEISDIGNRNMLICFTCDRYLKK